MCVSTICPTTWLRLATSFQLRGSSGVKLGFEGGQSFSICKWNNSDNNFGQYQWNLRYPSFCTSTVHAIRAAEIPPLISCIVRYQFRKYSAVRKGQVQDALEGSFHLGESLGKPSKLKRSRTKFGVTVNKDLLQDTCLLEEHLHLQNVNKPKNSRRKLDVINPNEEPIQKITKSKKTRRKLDVTDSNEDLLDTAPPSVECLTKTSKPKKMKSKVGVVEPNKEMIEVSSLLEEAVGKCSKSKETSMKLKVTDSNEARNLAYTAPLEKPLTSRKRHKLHRDSDEVSKYWPFHVISLLHKNLVLMKRLQQLHALALKPAFPFLIRWM